MQSVTVTSVRVQTALSRTLFLGAACATALAALLGWLASRVIAGATMRFDVDARDAIHAFATPAFTKVMIVASGIGQGHVLVPLTVLIIAVFWFTGHKQRAVLLAIAMTGALIIENTLKIAIRRARPVPFFDYPLPASFSFPSGHALFSVVFFGTLAALLSPGLRAKWKKAILWAAAALMAALIGVSRIYLGVHYPTDVIAGYTTALVWVIAVAIGNHLRLVGRARRANQ